MTPARLLSLLLLFIAVGAIAQPSDVALGIRLPDRVAAGADMPVAVSVTNLGPNATIAFVRIPHLTNRYPATPGDTRCHFSEPAMTCDVAVKPGETATLNVNLATPRTPGRATVSAEAFLYPADFDESNNRASASVELVAQPDLAVSLVLSRSFRPLGESTIFLIVQNLAGFPVQADAFLTIPLPLQVKRTSPNCVAVDATTYRCTGTGSVTVFVPARGEPVTLEAWVDASDFDASNNRIVRVEPIYDLASLKLEVAADDRLDESSTGTVRYSVTNESDFDAPNVVLTLYSSGNPVTASAPGCTADAAGVLTCSIGTLAAGERREIVATVRYKAREGVDSIQFFADQPLAPGIIGSGTWLGATAVHYRYFTVTSVADDGAGTLRAAIGALNEQCAGKGAPPCKIAFELGEGWQTIAPRSPLPIIHARHLALDGGGKVFLDGRNAGSGDGLSIEAGTLTVRGFAIGNFPGSGILAATLEPAPSVFDLPPVIEDNRIGVDPDGNAAPNGMRGVMGGMVGLRVRGNVIANNGRSGLFLQSWSNDIRDNRIESNGASGIFLGDATDSVVENNVIAGNAQFGVCIGKNGRTEIRANRIAGNGGGAFDIGLDGPTPAGAPQLDAARFEKGETVIVGRVEPLPPPGTYQKTKTVYLFANHEVDAEGFAEGEEFIGAAAVRSDGSFALRVARDLRGLWIDGTVLVVTDYGDAIYKASSELGPPLRVSE